MGENPVKMVEKYFTHRFAHLLPSFDLKLEQRAAADSNRDTLFFRHDVERLGCRSISVMWG